MRHNVKKPRKNPLMRTTRTPPNPQMNWMRHIVKKSCENPLMRTTRTRHNPQMNWMRHNVKKSCENPLKRTTRTRHNPQMNWMRHNVKKSCENPLMRTTRTRHNPQMNWMRHNVKKPRKNPLMRTTRTPPNPQMNWMRHIVKKSCENLVRKPSDADHTHSSQPSDELDAAQREKTTNEFHAISRDDNVITLADLEHYYFEVRKFKRGYQLEAEMKEMVETYGDSGTINLQQYLNMEATQMKEELSPEDLEAMFKYLDADNDGSLSAADLKEAQQVIGTDLAGRMQQMMQELIGEQDGVISLEEFKKWMMLDQDKTMKSQNTADS
eukprot:TRINITY_DN6142_c0_g1_i1.p1 TRINITY_DN6142_c0_g1~~TRINITY_DN6142_c0_g1_i1.p1  ORF type:complete len:324 (+),score=40.35 TRINITY_DN6142_c0_g1_i1:3-974(+)